jgi:hypothetical protein
MGEMSAQAVRDSRGASEVLAAMRVMYAEFPEMRKLLEDGDKRNRMHTILAAALGTDRIVSVDEAIAVVMASGYHVTRGPVEIAPVKSVGPGAERRTPAPDTVIRTVTSGSQQGRLLLAYAANGDGPGLTDEEARVSAGIAERSCWWKRCGELRAAGLIAPLEDAEGVQVTRTGSSGMQRAVCVITPEGRAVAGSLE